MHIKWRDTSNAVMPLRLSILTGRELRDIRCAVQKLLHPTQGLGDLQLIVLIQGSGIASEGPSMADENKAVKSDEFVNKLVHG